MRRRTAPLATARALLACLTCLASLAALLAVAPAAAAGDRFVPLRVATYNIAAGTGADGRFDPARTARALRELDADVVGLEEVDVHWGARSQWRDLAGELAEALDTHVYFAPIYTLPPAEPGAPDREFGLAVLSRYPILSAENHEITRMSTQDPNPVPAPAPGFPEVVVNARGALVHVYATHLDYRADPTVRKRQVADTRRILADDCDSRRCPPRLLVGDFNATPDAPELAPLWDRLADAWKAAGSTGPGLTYPAAAPVKRIDYVTASDGVRVRAARVPETLASDHRPVVADLLLPRGCPASAAATR